MVFTGNANPTLAAEIATHLGIEVGAAHVGRFSDGEVTVEINQNVRARDVFVVQSTCANTALPEPVIRPLNPFSASQSKACVT